MSARISFGKDKGSLFGLSSSLYLSALAAEGEGLTDPHHPVARNMSSSTQQSVASAGIFSRNKKNS